MPLPDVLEAFGRLVQPPRASGRGLPIRIYRPFVGSVTASGFELTPVQSSVLLKVRVDLTPDEEVTVVDVEVALRMRWPLAITIVFSLFFVVSAVHDNPTDRYALTLLTTLLVTLGVGVGLSVAFVARALRVGVAEVRRQIVEGLRELGEPKTLAARNPTGEAVARLIEHSEQAGELFDAWLRKPPD